MKRQVNNIMMANKLFELKQPIAKRICDDRTDLLCEMVCRIVKSHDYSPVDQDRDDCFAQISALLQNSLETKPSVKDMILFNPYEYPAQGRKETYFGSILIEIFSHPEVIFPDHIISRIIDIGGSELLLMERARNHESVLHIALRNGGKYKHILQMLEVGGFELLNINPSSYHTPTGMDLSALDMCNDSTVLMKMMRLAVDYMFSNSIASYPDVSIVESEEEACKWLRGDTTVMHWANTFIRIVKRLGVVVPETAVGDTVPSFPGFYWQVSREFIISTLTDLRWDLQNRDIVADIVQYRNDMRMSCLLRLMLVGSPPLPMSILREIIMMEYPLVKNTEGVPLTEAQKLAILDEHEVLLKQQLISV